MGRIPSLGQGMIGLPSALPRRKNGEPFELPIPILFTQLFSAHQSAFLMGSLAGPGLLTLLDDNLLSNEPVTFFANRHRDALSFLKSLGTDGLAIPEHFRALGPCYVVPVHSVPALQGEGLGTEIQRADRSIFLLLALLLLAHLPHFSLPGLARLGG